MDIVNELIKKLRIRKGMSLEQVAGLMNISTQGYHLWEQGLRSIKIEYLIRLSKILGFELKITNGILTIAESIPYKNEGDDLAMSEQQQTIVNTNEMVGYDIATMYTSTDNINYEENTVIDWILLYDDKQEAMEVLNTESIVKVYALRNLETNSIKTTTISLNKIRAYSVYYWNYAPLLDDSGTIFIDNEKQIKVKKAYVSIDIKSMTTNGRYKVTYVSDVEGPNTIGMFKVTDLFGNYIPQMDCLTLDFTFIS